MKKFFSFLLIFALIIESMLGSVLSVFAAEDAPANWEATNTLVSVTANNPAENTANGAGIASQATLPQAEATKKPDADDAGKISTPADAGTTAAAPAATPAEWRATQNGPLSAMNPKSESEGKDRTDRDAGNQLPQAGPAAPINIDLEIKPTATNDDGSQKLEYRTGENITLYASFASSSESGIVNNAKTRITVPKNKVPEKPNFSNTESANLQMTEDENNWYATYIFASIVGGQKVGIPFSFQNPNIITPNGHITPVTYEVLNAQNEVIATTTQNITARAETMEPVFQWNFSSIYPKINSGLIIREENWHPTQIIKKTVFDDAATITPQDTLFGYNIWFGLNSHNYDDKIGMYAAESFDLVIKLPAGATFSKDANYSNTKWEYTADTHSIKYTGEIWDSYKPWSWKGNPITLYKDVYIGFPNQNFDTVHHAHAIITKNPGKPNQEIIEKDWYIKFEKEIANKRLYTVFYPNSGIPWYSEKPAEKAIWRLNMTIFNSVPQEFHKVQEFEFYDLDTNLYYQELYLSKPRRDQEYQAIAFKVYGVMNDDTEERIPQESIEEKDTSYSITLDTPAKKYKKIIVRFDSPYAVKQGEWISSDLYVWVLPEYWNAITPDTIDAIAAKNYNAFLRVTYTDALNDELKNQIQPAVIKIVKATNNVNLWGFMDGNEAVFNAVSQKNFSRIFRVARTDHKDIGITKNLRTVILLPRSIDFVWKYNNTDIDPKVISNYKNTGKTALLIESGDWNRDKKAYWLNVRYKFRVNANLPEWIHDIEQYSFWDDDTTTAVEYENASQVVADTLDLDGDGNTTEKFAKKVYQVNNTPPREIITYVEVSPDKKFTTANIVAELGDTVNYKTTVLNNSLNPVQNISMLTVLPRQGDKSIVANNAGQHEVRGSQFAVELTNSLESIAENQPLLADWDIFYSTDSQGDTLEQTKNANWVRANAITNWNDVKMIKINQKSGRSLAIRSEAGFIIPARIPNLQTISANAEARNSTAISFNGRDYIESQSATLKIAKYTMSGKIFNDKNKNGEQDADETLLTGYSVALKNEAGVTLKTMISTDGNYAFDILREGKYYAEITHKGTSDLISPVVATTETGNHATKNVGANTSKTQILTFAKGVENAYGQKQNFGLSISLGSLTIHAVDNQDQNLEGVTFRIQKDGQKIGNSQVTNAQGKIVISDLAFGNYEIIAENTPIAYRLDATPKTVTIDENTINPIVKVPHQKQTWNVKIVKTKQGGERLAGATFELRHKNGNRVGDAKITPQNGEIIFTGIEYGEYTIVETSAPVGYVEAQPISITTASFSKTSSEILLNVENQKQTWNVKIIKKDATGKLLAGAVFELRDGDNHRIWNAKTTGTNGEIIFENITRGDYKIVETSAPIGYTEATPTVVSQNDFIKTVTEIIKNIVNTKQLWDLKIVATNTENEFLSGATFELHNVQNQKIGTPKMTNKNGEVIFNDLTLDDYKILQTGFLLGYEGNSEHAIAKTLFKKNERIATIAVKNQKQLWNLKIFSMNEKGDKPLSGAEFELRNDKNQIVGTKVKVANDGVANFDNIPVGNYTLVEVTAPNGHNKASAVAITVADFQITPTVNINSNTKTIQKIVTHTTIPYVGGGNGSPSAPTPVIPVRPLAVNQPETGGIEKPLFSAPTIGGKCISAVTNIDDPKVNAYYSQIGVQNTNNTARALTRVEFIKLLLNAGNAKINDIQNAEIQAILQKFDDVDVNAWYAPYIAFAVREGIMSGQQSGQKMIFRPNDTISRAEASKILTQTTLEKETKLPTEIKSFIDVDVNNSLARYIENVYLTCLLHGTNTRNGEVIFGEAGRKFSPFKNITLGETTKILYNMTHSTLDGKENNVIKLQK